jgi:predicted amidophosphoribosyltransferase
VKKYPRNRFESALAAKSFTEHTVTERFFPAQRIPTEKNCPNCTEQLPLSALICDACDYNFLSRSVGGKHKLLAAPESAAQVRAKPRLVPAQV